VEWKPDQPNWKEQEQQIIQNVDKMKKRAANRNTKFILLIVTNVKPTDLTLTSTVDNEVEVETLKVDDFYHSLKKTCNMDSNKHIQQIQQGELDNALVLNAKIGKVLQDLSVNYYKDQANRVKKLKSEVSPGYQPHLFARHRFKVAFYTEVSLRGFSRQTSGLSSANNSKVLKYLAQSYSYLMAILPKDHGVGENEIKAVGDIINFKICQMKLTDKKTVDQGVKQFLKHIAWFKQLNNEHKRKHLTFVHYANTYRQYRMFGEMLDALPATFLRKDDSYHNPGYYFQAAAAQAKFRKNYALKQCERYRDAIQTLLANNDVVIQDLRRDNEACYEGYYGQQIEIDPLTFLNESMNISARDLPSKIVFRDIAKEVLTVKHSEDIVAMLTKAYNHFKKHQTLKRLIYSIASNIAEEHFYSQEWERAKNFFDRISKTYKKEQWYHLLSSVKKQALVCSRHLNKPKDYLTNLIDLMSTQLQTSQQERNDYMDDLLSFLNQTKDFDMSPLTADSPLVIEMDNKHVLLTMKLQFEKPFVCVYERVDLNLQFTCHSPRPLQFQKLQVRFKDKSYNFTVNDRQDLAQVFTYDDGSNGIQQHSTDEKKSSPDSHILNLTLNPNSATTLMSFPMTIKEKQEFECESVSLYLVGQNGQQICFIWKLLENKYYSSMLANYDHRYEVGHEDLFVERPVIRVIEPKPKLEIKFEGQPPALINEYYAMKIILVSLGDTVVKGKLKLNFPPTVRPFYLEQEGELVEVPPSGFNVENIPQHTPREIIVFLQCTSPGMIRIKTVFDYEATLYPTLHQEAELDIYVQYPFEANFTYMGSRSTGGGSFRLVPSQTISFFQKIINNSCHNVAVNDPRHQQSQTDSNQFRYNEGFPAQQQIVLATTLSCNTPFPLLLDKVQIIPAEHSSEDITGIECCSPTLIDFAEKRKAAEASNTNQAILKEYVAQRDSYTSSFVLKSHVSGRSVKTGSLLITCRRLKQQIVHGADCNSIQYEIPLPSLNIYHRNLRASFESPSEAVLGKPFQVTLTIYNDSSTLQELQLHVSESESFFFSGTTLLSFTILPYSQKTLTYTMIPVLTGNVSFPKFTVKAMREQVHVLTERERWTIFVHML
jgi:hypothetical protein